MTPDNLTPDDETHDREGPQPDQAEPTGPQPDQAEPTGPQPDQAEPTGPQPDEAPTARMTSGDPLNAPERPGGGGDPPPPQPPGGSGGEPPHEGGDEPPPEPPPHPAGDPQPGPEGPRKLTRSGADRVIGGVAGGLGRYFSVDPLMFRIAFVVFSFIGGSGVLAYLILLAFVPSDGESTELSGSSKVLAIAGAVVLGVAAVAFLGPPAIFLGPGLLAFGLVVVVVVLLWRAVGGQPGDDPGRMVARIALAVIIALMSVAAVAAVTVIAALGGTAVVATLAVVAGISLVAAAFIGGARWLILPALILAIPPALVSAADVEFEGDVGSRHYRPQTVADLRPLYQMGMGELELDLRDLELPPGRTNVKVDMGIGGVYVRVPDDACVSTDVEMDLGDARVFGVHQDGVDVAFSESADPALGRPVLALEADVGFGELVVNRDGRFREDFHEFRFDDSPDFAQACPA
jgi:phage shock protein PspC (stress-responsive transcriptional regulator)